MGKNGETKFEKSILCLGQIITKCTAIESGSDKKDAKNSNSKAQSSKMPDDNAIFVHTSTLLTDGNQFNEKNVQCRVFLGKQIDKLSTQFGQKNYDEIESYCNERRV